MILARGLLRAFGRRWALRLIGEQLLVGLHSDGWTTERVSERLWRATRGTGRNRVEVYVVRLDETLLQTEAAARAA